MGFIETLKEVMTNKPINLKKPKFIKEFNEENKQIKELKNLLKYADKEASNLINEDIKLFTYGLYGEKNVAYELNHSNMPTLILHDLNLKYKGKTAQIDFVVISRYFILIIECKNMVGDITITNDGAFIRSFKGSNGKVYRKEGMYSPLTQNERHVELVKEIIKDHFKKRNSISVVKHCVVLANEKTIINDKFAPKEVKNNIIRCDQLINKMKLLNEENKNGMWLTEETMYKVANLLLDNEYDKSIDYASKYGITIENEDIIHKEIGYEKEKDVIVEKDKLYQEIKQYRYNKSKEENLKAYCIFTNKVLEDIVDKCPRTIEELMSISGLGKVKCEKYGNDILSIIEKYV